jgi:hypothetical protein
MLTLPLMTATSSWAITRSGALASRVASVQPSELPASISSARCRSALIAMARCQRRSAARVAPASSAGRRHQAIVSLSSGGERFRSARTISYIGVPEVRASTRSGGMAARMRAIIVSSGARVDGSAPGKGLKTCTFHWPLLE